MTSGWRRGACGHCCELRGRASTSGGPRGSAWSSGGWPARRAPRAIWTSSWRSSCRGSGASARPTRREGPTLLDALTADRADARARVLAALDSPRYFALVDRLVAEAGSPRLSGRRLRMGPLVTERVSADAQGGAAGGRRAGRRRRCTACGSRASARGTRASWRRFPTIARGRRSSGRRRTSRTCSERHQDAVVAEERLRAVAAGADSAVAVAAGRLVEQETLRRAEARNDLPDALKALARAAKRWTLIG